jgi:hypothetical protein
LERGAQIHVPGSPARSVPAKRMSNSPQQCTQHEDWRKEPGEFRVEHRIHKHGLVAYILGTGTNGKRYCRTVDLPSEDPDALHRFDVILALVTTLGPSVCKELVEGEELPSEIEMPLLTKWEGERHTPSP